jgi:hypothetical protein
MSNMFLNVVSTFKGDGLTAATRQLGAFGSAAGGLGSTLGKVGAALASFGIAAKAVQFTKESIDSARDLERNLFSVKTIFDEFAPAIEKFTLNAEQMGLSQKDAAKASTFLGSVLKQSGFSMEFVTAETQKLVSLGVDLAATYGYDVQEALLGMTALFRGEYDPIEKFGVAMKQSEINSELAARGFDKLEGAARRNAEQTIRLELLYQRAADASGAFRAQSGNLYVEQKKLQAAWENMQATVGTQLLPAMGGLVEVLKPLVDELTPRLVQVVRDANPAIQTLTAFIKDLGDEATTTGQTASFISDSIGTFFRILSENFGVITQAALLIGGLRIAFILLTAAMNATPIGLALTGLGLLAGAFLLVNDAAKKAEINTRELNKQFVDNPWQQAANPARVYSGILSDVIRKDFDPHVKNIEEIKKVWTRAESAAFDYSKVARTAAKSRPLRGGQAESAFAAQDFSSGLNPDEDTDKDTSGKKEPSIMGDLKKEATKTRLAGKLIGKGLSEGLAEQITDKGPKAARKQLAKIEKTAGKHGKKLQKIYNKTKAGKAEIARKQASDDARQGEIDRENDRLAQELADREKARLDEQARVYESFLDSVKSTFASIKNSIMGAFDITALGGSTNSIIRNMNKLLSKVKDFSKNISQLATMGLNPALLQQVISAGPMAGGRLAAALVSGGANALSQINAGYGEFGNLASDIATTGTNALFGTQAQQNVYNINVSGGVGSGATIGKAIVDAIKAYERTSGAVWQGA